MPLLTFEETAMHLGLNDFTGTPVPRERRPDAVTKAAAMFRVENSLSSFLAFNENRPGSLTEQELDDYRTGVYDPVKRFQDKGFDFEKYGGDISKLKSLREEEHFLTNLDRERRDREIIGSISTGESLGWAALSGILDPIFAPAVLIPGAFAGPGARFLATGGTAAGLAAGGEVVLHQTQAEREIRESVYNMGGAFVLAGVLGTTFGSRFSPEAKASFIRSIDHDGDLMGPRMPMIGTGIGADVLPEVAREFIPPATLKDINARLDAGDIDMPTAQREAYTAWKDNTTLKNAWMLKPFKIFHPGLALALSERAGIRTAASALSDDAYLRTYNKHALGADAQPVTIAIKTSQDAKGTFKIAEILDTNYAAYLGRKEGILNQNMPWGAISEKMTQRTKGLNTYEEFSEQTIRAIMDGGEHADPHVKAAALSVENDVISRVMQDQIDVGMIKLKEGEELMPLHGDKGNYPRVFNVQNVNNRHQDFISTVAQGFSDYIKIKKPKIWAEMTDVLDETDINIDMQRMAGKYQRSILNSPTGHVSSQGITYKGDLEAFLGNMNLDVSSRTLMDEDFLVKELGQSMNAWLRNVVPNIEIRRKFSTDDVSLSELMADLRKENQEYVEGIVRGKMGDDYIELRSDVLPSEEKALAKQTKLEDKLHKDFNLEMRKFDNMRKYMLHEYARPDDPGGMLNGVLTKLRAFNVMTDLGGMTLASASDLGSAMIRVGAAPFAKSIVKFALSLGAKMPRAQAAKWGAGMDLATNSRLNQLGMIDDVGYSKLDRLMKKGTQHFSKASGMAQWNAIMKQLAALSIADSLGKMAAKAKLSVKDQTMLSRMGINGANWERMKVKMQTHGTTEKGWRIPNEAKWDDEALQDLFTGAVVRDADNAIVTPGPGDLPFAAYGELGRMLFQFKTFMFAIQNRAILPGIQQANTDSIIGMTSMVGLGAAAYVMKQIAAGKDVSDLTGEQLIKEGINQSGVTGMLFGLDTMLHDLSGGELGIQAALFDDDLPASRYMAQSMVSSMIGPWYGTATDLAQATNGMMTSVLGGDVQPGDVAAGRRLMPTQNMFYLRRGWNELETALGGREFDK